MPLPSRIAAISLAWALAEANVRIGPGFSVSPKTVMPGIAANRARAWRPSAASWAAILERPPLPLYARPATSPSASKSGGAQAVESRGAGAYQKWLGPHFAHNPPPPKKRESVGG